MKKFDKIYKFLYLISLIIIFLNNHNYLIFNRTTKIIINVISIIFMILIILSLDTDDSKIFKKLATFMLIILIILIMFFGK